MSHTLFVSETALLACGQIFLTLTTAIVLHRRVATARSLSLSSLCPNGTKVWMCQLRHDGFYAHLIWLCPHETHGFYSHLIWLCPHETHGFYTHPSHCVPLQHNAFHHTDTSECDVYVMWSASFYCEFISVNSRKYSTIDFSYWREYAEHWTVINLKTNQLPEKICLSTYL